MGRILTPGFGEGIVQGTNTYLMIWRWYSSTDEYVPLVVERVFVQGTNTCPIFWRGYSRMGRILTPCFGEGIRPTDEYSPHDLEMVFVHGRILASCCVEGNCQKPTNSFVFALRILWGRINDIVYTSTAAVDCTAAVDYRDSLLVR